MTQKHDGGPAYPTVAGHTVYSNGMSLRDYFAGQALEGFLASWPVNGRPAQAETWAAVAAKAYEVSDAMLAARSGGET